METKQTAVFQQWLQELRDQRAETRIRVRIARIEAGNLGDTRSVGGGVSEVRIDYGQGYRLYFTRRGEELLILLCGGDKSSQARDIRKARQIATEFGGGTGEA